MEDIIRPFIPYKAFDWLENWITPDMRVFEYGSGMSTLWFAQNASEVVAVENHLEWFDTIRGKLDKHGIENYTYLYETDGEKYSKCIYDYQEPFDLVFIDGRFRKECMEECFPKAKYAILFDNSDAHHYQDAYDVMKTFTGGSLIDFFSYGLNPYTGEDLPDMWQASVFLKNV